MKDQTNLEQTDPPSLDKSTESGKQDDGAGENLTNMGRLNGETVDTNGPRAKVAKYSEDKILILHFNDVYNIEPREREPVGGAARFASKIATFKSRNPLVLFSGDALNPSMSEC